MSSRPPSSPPKRPTDVINRGPGRGSPLRGATGKDREMKTCTTSFTCRDGKIATYPGGTEDQQPDRGGSCGAYSGRMPWIYPGSVRACGPDFGGKFHRRGAGPVRSRFPQRGGTLVSSAQAERASRSGSQRRPRGVVHRGRRSTGARRPTRTIGGGGGRHDPGTVHAMMEDYRRRDSASTGEQREADAPRAAAESGSVAVLVGAGPGGRPDDLYGDPARHFGRDWSRRRPRPVHRTAGHTTSPERRGRGPGVGGSADEFLHGPAGFGKTLLRKARE